jgi:predicted membrane protein
MNADRFDPIGDRRTRRGIPFSGRLVFGAVMLTLGVLWTLDNLNLMDADSILRWWPALLAWFGVFRIFGILGPRSVVSGTLFFAVGFWMLLRELGVVHVSIFRLWPVFLIVLGAVLVWRSMRGEQEPEGADRDAHPRPFAIMGGVVRSIESQELVAIEATAVMGGVELDLRGAKSRDREVIVDVFAWWGGVELFVPDDWRVVTEISPIMGGVEDKSRLAAPEAVTTLVVRGFAIMGGVEIRNKRRKDGEFRGVHVGVTGLEVKAGTTGDSQPRERDPRD